MLYQEYDQQFDYEWLTADDQLTCFSKYREQILWRAKGAYLTYVQGTQSSEEDLFTREMVPRSTERPSVREPGTNENHETVSQSYNDDYSENIQDTPLSMDNVCLEGTEETNVTSPSREALGRNFYVRNFERIRKSPQRYEPLFGAAREWKSDSVASLVYMNQDGDIISNVDMYNIL